MPASPAHWVPHSCSVPLPAPRTLTPAWTTSSTCSPGAHLQGSLPPHTAKPPEHTTHPSLPFKPFKPRGHEETHSGWGSHRLCQRQCQISRNFVRRVAICGQVAISSGGSSSATSVGKHCKRGPSSQGKAAAVGKIWDLPACLHQCQCEESALTPAGTRKRLEPGRPPFLSSILPFLSVFLF